MKFEYNFSCAIAFALLFSNIIMMLIPPSNTIELIKSLPDKQKRDYINITKERLLIYIKGLVIGLLTAYIYSQVYSKSTPCENVAIVLMMTCFIYTILPKSKYMITELKTEEQRILWLSVYNEQKLKGHISGFVGFLILPILAFFSK